MTYHRMLTHHSFKVPKALEYVLAWFGCMAVQDSPIAWVSHHRIHHLHTDTPLDPHSPCETKLLVV
jgi:stearoyl-CoA desaturase (delta-9 desaturase)